MHYPFNVRAYGLVLHNHQVLVTDEFRMGQARTKFPGGGLEFGEGLNDCIRREIMEELGFEVLSVKHFYTTDFFVASAFDSTAQVISVYFLVTLSEENLACIPVSAKFAWENPGTDGEQLFRWLSINQALSEDMTFPIDQHVAQLLASNPDLSNTAHSK